MRCAFLLPALASADGVGAVLRPGRGHLPRLRRARAETRRRQRRAKAGVRARPARWSSSATRASSAASSSARSCSGNGAIARSVGAPRAELSFICLLASDKQALFFHWMPRRDAPALAQCKRGAAPGDVPAAAARARGARPRRGGGIPLPGIARSRCQGRQRERRRPPTATRLRRGAPTAMPNARARGARRQATTWRGCMVDLTTAALTSTCNEPSPVRRADDGLDRPALPVFPAPGVLAARSSTPR